MVGRRARRFSAASSISERALRRSGGCGEVSDVSSLGEVALEMETDLGRGCGIDAAMSIGPYEDEEDGCRLIRLGLDTEKSSCASEVASGRCRALISSGILIRSDPS